LNWRNLYFAVMMFWSTLIYALFASWGTPVESHVHVREFSDTLQWTPTKILGWSDFKAEAPRSRFAAYTFTVITMDYSIKSSGKSLQANFSITSAFNRQKSWVKNTSESKTDAILRHEQLHFDIAELSARKLRKKLSELKLTRERYAKQIQAAYDEVIGAGEAMQKAYDEETAHGLLRDEQKRWSDKIASELLDYIDYSK
jgi:hypothetical protein